MNNNYRIALSEVNEILKYTDDDIVSRIPKKFITFISDNMDTNHKFKVQENVELFEQPIRNETKTILAMIYKDYFCDDVERQELIDYDKMQKDIEEKIKYEKYNSDNIFKNINKDKVKEEVALVEVKEEKWYDKVFKFFRKIFRFK